MKESNFISAVLYVHNSEKVIVNALQALINIFSKNFIKYEIICVNDSSVDNSAEVIKSFIKNTDSVATLITTSFYQGIERSMTAGVDLCIGDFILEFDDALFDFEPSLIMELYQRCLCGFDIVSASQNKNVSLSSKLFYSIYNKYSGTQYKLASEKFRIISRRGINRVQQMNTVILYRKALYANCGLKTENIVYSPLIETRKIKYGLLERSHRQKLAVNSLIMFTDIAYKFSIFLSMLMLFITVFSIIYTIVIFVQGNPVQGWTTTMLLLSIGLFGIFSVLTFAVKYLDIIVNLIFERRKYVIENIEKL